MDHLDENSCRICFTANASVHLFDDTIELNAATLLESATNIKVQPQEHISNLICLNCLDSINASVKLKKDVEEAENRWNNMLVYVWVLKEEEQPKTNIKPIKLVEHDDALIEADENFSHYDEVELKIEVDNLSVKHEVDDKERTCDQCGKEFQCHANLLNHIRTHIELVERDGVCIEDDEDYSHHDEVDLKIEVDNLSVEQPNKRVKLEVEDRERICDQCGKEFQCHANLLNHIRTHIELVEHDGTCINDNEEYRHDDEVKLKIEVDDLSVEQPNKRVKHEVQDKELTCDQCGKEFGCHANLLNHIRTHIELVEHDGDFIDDAEEYGHDDEVKLKIEVDDLSVEQPNKRVKHKLEDNERKCDQCGQEFQCHANLLNHIQTHIELREHDGACIEGDEEYRHDDDVELKTEIADLSVEQPNKRVKHKMDDKERTCNQCGKEFRCHANLLNHIRTHKELVEHDDASTEEDEEYSSDDEVELKLEVDNLSVKQPKKRGKYKMNDKERTCDLCGKEFGCHANLLNHRRKHTGEKPFECDVCFKRFSQNCNLIIHQRNHKNWKPYVCEICSKQFTQSGNLQQHMFTHKPNRDFKCPECSKLFRHKTSLKIHLATHTGVKSHKCSSCNKSFSRINSLNKHIRTVHNKEKRHVCTECNKAFSNTSNLQAHFRIHTGEKPFECKYCDSKFNQSSPLVRHVRQHVKNNDELKSPASVVNNIKA